MYRPPPGVGVDPWYENFKFFLTYWLLSSNRDRMGEADQMQQQPPPPPPPPPPPTGHHYLPPHQKPSPPPHIKPTSSPWQQNKSVPTRPNVNLNEGYGEGLKSQMKTNISPKQQGLPPGEQVIIDKDRRHVCPHCYKGFRSRQQLNQHSLVHSNVRKYRCHYCERAFKQLSHLQQHHRIHTGEKPYRCPLDGCDKAFAQMSNLQHHMRQHDKATFGQKQCLCPFCDRGYASEKSLRSHVSKMHPDSKMLEMQSPRSMEMIESQPNPFYDGNQPLHPIPHKQPLSTMPRAPNPTSQTMTSGQISRPLELTVTSSPRNTMPNDSKFTPTSDGHLDSKLLQRYFPSDGKYFQRENELSGLKFPPRDFPERDVHFNQRRAGYDDRFDFANREISLFGRQHDGFPLKFPQEAKGNFSGPKNHGMNDSGLFHQRFMEQSGLYMNGRGDGKYMETNHTYGFYPGGRDRMEPSSSLHMNLRDGMEMSQSMNPQGRSRMQSGHNLHDDRDNVKMMETSQDLTLNGREGRKLNEPSHSLSMDGGNGKIMETSQNLHINQANEKFMEPNRSLTRNGHHNGTLLEASHKLQMNGTSNGNIMENSNNLHLNENSDGDNVQINGNDGKILGNREPRRPSPSQNSMDTMNSSLSRQRKRKPSNPQHVFSAPPIDHYTSFASDEMEDCGSLVLDVDENSYDQKIQNQE